MEPDHPPVEILRLGARGAVLLGLFAGAVHAVHVAPLAALDLTLLLWILLAGTFVAAAVTALLVPEYEAVAGAALVCTAAVATLVGGGVRTMALLGWEHGYALLFLISGLFYLSAWGWTRREEALRPQRAPHEDAERIDG